MFKGEPVFNNSAIIQINHKTGHVAYDGNQPGLLILTHCRIGTDQGEGDRATVRITGMFFITSH